MPLLPVWVVVACYRAKFTFTFTLISEKNREINVLRAFPYFETASVLFQSSSRRSAVFHIAIYLRL
jgi:hypothetical protein